MAGSRKVYPQVIVIEVVFITICAVGVHFLAGRAGIPHDGALLLAGAAADRLLILVLRHGNKRPRRRLHSITFTRKPAGRRR